MGRQVFVYRLVAMVRPQVSWLGGGACRDWQTPEQAHRGVLMLNSMLYSMLAAPAAINVYRVIYSIYQQQSLGIIHIHCVYVYIYLSFSCYLFIFSLRGCSLVMCLFFLFLYSQIYIYICRHRHVYTYKHTYKRKTTTTDKQNENKGAVHVAWSFVVCCSWAQTWMNPDIKVVGFGTKTMSWKALKPS